MLDTGLHLVSKKKRRQWKQEIRMKQKAEQHQRRQEIRVLKRRRRKQLNKLRTKQDYRRCRQCNRKVYNISSRTKWVTACATCLNAIFHGFKPMKRAGFTTEQKQMVRSWYRQAQRQSLAQKTIRDAEAKEWKIRSDRLSVMETVNRCKRLMAERYARMWKAQHTND